MIKEYIESASLRFHTTDSFCFILQEIVQYNAKVACHSLFLSKDYRFSEDLMGYGKLFQSLEPKFVNRFFL